MRDKFYIGCPHLGHSNILKFKRNDGSPLRDFRDLDHMHNTIITQWNAVVPKEHSRVYVLGDVAFSTLGIQILAQLHGQKILILGNHDKYPVELYRKYFKEIRGDSKNMNFMLSHVPIHPSSISRWCVGNVHAHVHYQSLNDPRYFNCCVEVVNYTPVPYETILKYFEDNRLERSDDENDTSKFTSLDYPEPYETLDVNA